MGLLLPAASASSAQAAAPQWKLTVTPNADYFLSGRYPGVYRIEAENVGNAPTAGEITIKDKALLPSGLAAEAVEFFDPDGGNLAGTDLHESLCPGILECRFPGALSGLGITSLPPGHRLDMFVRVGVPAGVAGSLSDEAEVSGGGAAAVAARGGSLASPEPPPGILHFASSLPDSSRISPYTQAGGHPYQLNTDFGFESYSAVRTEQKVIFKAGTNPVHDPREAVGALPPGLLANPQAVPHCQLADFYSGTCEVNKDAVGYIGLQLAGYSPTASAFRQFSPVLNLQPQGGTPGELGIIVAGLPIATITAGVRSGSDYGITATSLLTAYDVTRLDLTVWGVPADESHNSLRGKECELPGAEARLATVAMMESECESYLGGGPAGYPPRPFLTMPTECSGSPLTLTGSYDTWQEPSFFTERPIQFPAVDSCNQLAGLFAPTIHAHPTTTHADSPSGLEFDLEVPQHEGANEYATPEVHEAVVALPKGLTINPSSANGLGACSPGQIGLRTEIGVTPAHFSETPANCPGESQIGTVEVHTALLHNPLRGAVYLATPHRNPFSSLLAAYIVVEGEGLIFKLPGRIETDPETGQITGKFLENPQLPFTDFHLEFFGGARGDVRTPATCGEYTTSSVLTPYSYPESGPPYEKATSSFETSEAAHEGEECPPEASGQPNAPVFRAGTESPQAGAFTPFSFRLARADGSQEIEKIETTLPPGLTGKLAGVAECSEAQLAVAEARAQEGGGAEEQASPSCPSSSEVGEVEVASGAGPTPLYVKGRAYLAGPYKGGPLSLAIITPAMAGPFDLGDVVVRTALYVNPETAQIKAVSDPIPHILQGIPLDVRSVTLKMARPNFTLNPTNCEEMGFAGTETSLLGNVAPLAQRFQVGGCRALPFKPNLSISLKGKTHRSGTPALKAVLTMPPGNANVASAQVTLPHSEFLDQGHLENICTRVQFNEHACPANSIYGHAVAYTPLLDHPLEGPVYLRSSSHLLPDLAVDLEGQINVVLDSKVDSVHESLRNTFEVVPDAPVSKFVLTMRGGKHSLIENSTDICLHRQRATGLFRGQNGKTVEVNPLLKVNCKGKGKHKHGKKGHRHH